MTVTLYGIPNCDTVKKARDWLAQHGIAYRFHDFRKDGLERERLAGWVEELGWESVLNRAGTTFRALGPGDKMGLGPAKAVALMLAQPAMVKRPVLDLGTRRLVGFKPEIYAQAFT